MRSKRTDSGDRMVISDPGSVPVSVARGGTTAVVGASGTGKTRWVRRLMGLDDPPLDLRRGGTTLSVAQRRPLMAFVPQGDGVFLDETVIQNVSQRPHGPSVSPKVARDCVELLQLGDRRNSPASELNTDERRRVSLARALALERPILVVDGFLTPSTMRDLPLSLVQLPWVDSVIVTATNASPDVQRAGTVAVVDNGRILTAGSWTEIMASSNPTIMAALSWVIPDDGPQDVTGP